MADEIQGVPAGLTEVPLEASSQIQGVPPGLTETAISGADQYPSDVKAYWEKRKQQEPDLPLDVAARQFKSVHPDALQQAPEHPLAAAGRVVGDVAYGGGKGVAETVRGGTELINKVLPAAVQLPVPFEGEDLSAQGLAEGAGKFGETLLEFIAGDEVLKGLTWAEKLRHASQLAKLAENSPRLAKVISGAVRSGVVGGAQAGVKSGGDVGETAAGAIGGGVGGAAGEALAMAPQAVKWFGDTIGFGLTAEKALTKAGRPSVFEGAKFARALDTALPRIQEMNPSKIKTVGDFVEMLGDEAQNIRKAEFGPMIDRNAKQMLSAHPVADNIIDAVTPQMEEYEPAVAKEIKDFAVRFRKDMPLAKAEQDLQYFNKQLAGYYKMGARDASRAAELEPQIAKYEAAADGMRDLIYSKLRELGEKAPEQLQRQYGALKDLERVFAKRATVADRQAPINLPQALALIGAAVETGGAMLAGQGIGGAVVGAAGIGVATAAKYRNAAESLIRQGIRAAQPAGAVARTVKAVGPAVGAAVRTVAPAGGAAAGRDVVAPGRVRFRDSEGGVHEVPSQYLEKAREIDPNLQVIPRP